MDTSGRLLMTLKMAYSLVASPLKKAFRKEPVRIRPGAMVVTVMPSRASSARRPSDRPTVANLAALYASKWGTLTLPPTDVMLTMRPTPRRRIWGRTAQIGRSIPHRMTSSASRKSCSVCSTAAPA